MLTNIYYIYDIIRDPCAVRGTGISAFTGGFHKMERTSTTEKSIRVAEGGHKKYDQIR